MWKLLSLCRSSWANVYVLIWMIALRNAVIIKNSISLIKRANEEPAQVPACCTAAAHCSLLGRCLPLCEQIATYTVVRRYVCAASFPRSASKRRGKAEPSTRSQNIFVEPWGFDGILLHFGKPEVHPSNHRAKQFILSATGTVCIPLAALCMGLVVMQNGWIIYKSTLSCL